MFVKPAEAGIRKIEYFYRNVISGFPLSWE